jgi:hypothetical protein
MIKHECVWYESDDGNIFTDESKCMNHEVHVLYNKSGIRFYTVNWEPVEFVVTDDWTYNHSHYMVIDRSKEKENTLLINYLYDNFGWCLVKEAFYMDGDTFVLEWNKAVPVPSHLVY